MSATDPQAPAAPGARGIHIVPLVVATALFMENMDSTIIATALPAIAHDLGVDPVALKLAVTAYLVGLAVFIPISGWVADRLGASTTFRTALAVFMAASVGCAFSSSLTEFVVWRFIQGIGGAMMVPVGRLVVIRAVPKADLVRAFAFLTTPSMIGPMLGPPLGGLLVTVASWRWIFFVNIPIGLLGIWLATLYMSDTKEEQGPLDFKGFLLSALGLCGLVLGAAVAGRHIAPPMVPLGLIAIGAIALLAYARHSLRTTHPLLDLRLFAIPTFSAGVAGGIFFRIGIGASAFLLPLMLQLAFGLDALHAGLVIFAGALGALLMKPWISWVLRRTGFRRVLVINSVLTAAAVAITGLFTAATPQLLIFVFLFVAGFLRSLQFTSLNAITYADVGQGQITPATTLANVAQQVSISIGVAIGALALEIAQSMNGQTAPAASDFSAAFFAIALLSLVSTWWMVRLSSEAGGEIAGRASAKEAG